MEEKYNKTQYKIFLILVKYLPFLIAVLYFISVILNCFGIYSQLLVVVSYYSPLTAFFMLYASFLFKCCIWHRLPIYYSLVLQIIININFYIPISSDIELFIYLVITIFFILLGMYLKNLHNGYKHNSRSHYNRNVD